MEMGKWSRGQPKPLPGGVAAERGGLWRQICTFHEEMPSSGSLLLEQGFI